MRPYFKLAGGRRKHSAELVRAITTVGGHHQHQVIQKTLDHVIVRIVPNHAWTAEHHQQLIEAVRAFFESPIAVQLEIKERLEPLPGGKLQSMVCEA
jgi:hypothetical protein